MQRVADYHQEIFHEGLLVIEHNGAATVGICDVVWAYHEIGVVEQGTGVRQVAMQTALDEMAQVQDEWPTRRAGQCRNSNIFIDLECEYVQRFG